MFVPPGSVITTQTQADALPSRQGSPYEKTNKAVLHVNEQYGYSKLDLGKIAQERQKQMERGMLDIGSGGGSSSTR
jgi:carbonic anhydrase